MFLCEFFLMFASPNLTVRFVNTETPSALFTSVPQGLEQCLVHGVCSGRLDRAEIAHLPQECLVFTSILLKTQDTT